MLDKGSMVFILWCFLRFGLHFLNSWVKFSDFFIICSLGCLQLILLFAQLLGKFLCLVVCERCSFIWLLKASFVWRSSQCWLVRWLRLGKSLVSRSFICSKAGHKQVDFLPVSGLRRYILISLLLGFHFLNQLLVLLLSLTRLLHYSIEIALVVIELESLLFHLRGLGSCLSFIASGLLDLGNWWFIGAVLDLSMILKRNWLWVLLVISHQIWWTTVIVLCRCESICLDIKVVNKSLEHRLVLLIDTSLSKRSIVGWMGLSLMLVMLLVTIFCLCMTLSGEPLRLMHFCFSLLGHVWIVLSMMDFGVPLHFSSTNGRKDSHQAQKSEIFHVF